jgi:cysteine desulfurase
VTEGCIYLDHAATTPVDPRVAAFMAEVLAENLGNPGASHSPGRRAAQLIEQARERVAALIGAAPDDIVFTSGATESNNLAILGHVRGERAERRRVGHVVTLATEHKAILAPVRKLEHEGLKASFLLPDPRGLFSADSLSAALRAETLLVTLLHVNNETGVAQDLPALAATCRAQGVALHIDAAQSAGKLAIALDGIDYLSFTAHKLGGPQGVGALYVAPHRRMAVEPLIVGGGQERGLRPGTLATHQIAGFGLACALAAADREVASQRMAGLRDRLQQGLADLPGVLLNGDPLHRAPGILNLSFEGVEGESLYAGLAELALSTGSACNSTSGEPSYVLRALGRDTQLAQSSLRFSLGRGTTQADVDVAIVAVRRELARLRALSPDQPPPVQDWLAQGARVVSGEGGARRLGTQLRFVLCVDGEFVKAARFQAYGCPHTLAACQAIAAHLPGRSRTSLLPGTPEQWRQDVGAPVEKLGRMLIIEDALRAAQGDWLN